MRSTFTAWSVLVGNVFNLIVAPQARRDPERLVWRCARGRCRVAPLGAAAACAHGVLGDLAFCPGRANRSSRHARVGRLLERLSPFRLPREWRDMP